MPYLLCISSSPMGCQSRSRAMLNYAAAQWDSIGTHRTIDLCLDPPPLISAAFVDAAFTPADQRDPAMKDALTYSDQMLADMRRADAVVIAAPMHNFGPPAALKAWIDQIVRPGDSFAMTGDAAQPYRGLLPDVPTALLTSRGTSDPSAPDHLHPMLREVLGMIGIGLIRQIELTGTDLHDFDESAAMKQAQAEIETFLRPFRSPLQHVA